MAHNTVREKDKAAWLRLAEEWLRLAQKKDERPQSAH
jgi:hypothetical protein